ncbi:MAG: sensor histidine kinase [Rhizobacter sp.]|nr:sensor histidine kinase [Ferruginibacter sp.]
MQTEKTETIFFIILATIIFFIVVGIILIVIVSLFQARKSKHRNEKQLLQSQHAQSLLQTQLEIQEQTLRTISQEIHDNVGQVLSLAKLNLKTLDMDTGVSREEKIDKSVELVSKAINDLRDLSRSINGDKIADLGLQDAIDNELKIIQNTGLFNTKLSIEGTAYILQNQHEMVIFRIVQESLNNAVKHSRAKNINILINYLPSFCCISITDDGEGFNTNLLEATQTGIGLKNMQSRATLINASLSIESAPGKGTKVLIKSANKTL